MTLYDDAQQKASDYIEALVADLRSQLGQAQIDLATAQAAAADRDAQIATLTAQVAALQQQLVALGPKAVRQPFYTLPASKPMTAYTAATDPTVKGQLWQIAGTPMALWMGGATGDAANVKGILDAATKAGQTPTFVTYAIPYRDGGGLSAGGLATAAQYTAWIDTLVTAIAGRPCIVILEPDAIALGSLTAAQKTDRVAMINYSMKALTTGDTRTYLHGGSPGVGAANSAYLLYSQGFDMTLPTGFALNVSSFYTTADCLAMGDAVSATVAGKIGGRKLPYVVDTSRNGLGPGSTSFNPTGRALGVRPGTAPGSSLCDAYLWVKIPGESDGATNGGPASGTFWQDYALGLVTAAQTAGTITTWPTGQRPS